MSPHDQVNVPARATATVAAVQGTATGQLCVLLVGTPDALVELVRRYGHTVSITVTEAPRLEEP